MIMWKIACCTWYRYECKCQRKKVIQETDEDVIFWSPGGSVYHTKRNCRGLRAVVDTTKVQACRMCLFCQKEKKVRESEFIIQKAWVRGYGSSPAVVKVPKVAKESAKKN